MQTSYYQQENSGRVISSSSSGSSGSNNNHVGRNSNGSMEQQQRQSQTEQHKGKPKLFPWLLHSLLDDADVKGFSHIVAWNPSGRSFKVHDREKFMNNILPQYSIAQTKYKSFVRQLNMWGFACIHGGRRAPERGSYRHECFIRGHPELCEHMKRIKIKGTGASKTVKKSAVGVNGHGPSDPSNGNDVRKIPAVGLTAPGAFLNTASAPTPPTGNLVGAPSGTQLWNQLQSSVARAHNDFNAAVNTMPAAQATTATAAGPGTFALPFGHWTPSLNAAAQQTLRNWASPLNNINNLRRQEAASENNYHDISNVFDDP